MIDWAILNRKRTCLGWFSCILFLKRALYERQKQMRLWNGAKLWHIIINKNYLLWTNSFVKEISVQAHLNGELSLKPNNPGSSQLKHSPNFRKLAQGQEPPEKSPQKQGPVPRQVAVLSNVPGGQFMLNHSPSWQRRGWAHFGLGQVQAVNSGGWGCQRWRKYSGG